MEWIDLAQDRYQWRALVNTVMNLRVLYNVEKFLSSCATGGFSRRTQLHGVTRSFRTIREMRTYSKNYTKQNLYWTKFRNMKPVGLNALTEQKETDFRNRYKIASRNYQGTREDPTGGVGPERVN
jgi:hypothetical protein